MIQDHKSESYLDQLVLAEDSITERQEPCYDVNGPEINLLADENFSIELTFLQRFYLLVEQFKAPYARTVYQKIHREIQR